MQLPSPLISWVNPFPSRVINKTIFFWNVLESHECACCLLSFLFFHWLFPLLARETSSGNRSIYKSTRERVDSKGFSGRWRLHLMGSWLPEPTRKERTDAYFALLPAIRLTVLGCQTTSINWNGLFIQIGDHSVSIATKLCRIQLTVPRVVPVCLLSAWSPGRVVGPS